MVQFRYWNLCRYRSGKMLCDWLEKSGNFVFADLYEPWRFPNHISIKYLNPRLRLNYFRFRKTDGRHIGILLPVSFDFWPLCSHRHVILHLPTKFGLLDDWQRLSGAALALHQLSTALVPAQSPATQWKQVRRHHHWDSSTSRSGAAADTSACRWRVVLQSVIAWSFLAWR